MSIEINQEKLSELSIADLYALKEILWYKLEIAKQNNSAELIGNSLNAWYKTMDQIDVKINDIFILD